MQEIIDRLKAGDRTAVKDFAAHFELALREMRTWMLKKAPKHVRKNDEGDVYSEGLAAVLKVAAEIQAGKELWDDDPEKYVKSEIYWAMHEYIGGELMKSDANNKRYRWNHWTKQGAEAPIFVEVNESDRLVDNDDLELIDTWDLIESCCHSDVELTIIKGCLTKTLRQVAEELGIPEQTASDRRKAVYQRYMEKKQEMLCDD